MRIRLAAAGAVLLMFGTSAGAHRLDEYLQATTIAVEKDHVQTQIRLTPGVAVVRRVLAGIDTDADGVISEPEQHAYAERVIGDLTLEIDGERLLLRLVSIKFPRIEEIEEGLGEILLEIEADAPNGGPERRLTLENRHQSSIAAYLVNCLVPHDPEIRIKAQDRNYTQSFYRVDYVQGEGRSVARSSGLRSSFWIGTAVVFVVAGLFAVAGIAFMRRRRPPLVVP